MPRLFAALLIALSACGAARAAEDKWEFGLDGGEAYPVSKNNYFHSIPNTKVLELLGTETVGDEVAEGFKAPNFTGSTEVPGSLKPMTDLGGHLFYKASKDLWVGLEGGYAVRRSIFINNCGIWCTTKFLDMTYEGNITHFDALAKYGHWCGIVRPNVALGPGIYAFREVLNVIFNDPDDPQVKPIAVIDHTLTFSGIAAQAGVDVKVAPHGTINLAVQYHKVWSPGNKLDFVLPRLQFVVAFGGESWF